MKYFVTTWAKLTLFLAISIFTCSGMAAEASSLEVPDAAICKYVKDRRPVGPGTSFDASVGKLYCHTRVTGAENPTSISHVWYFGETERARVDLPVDSANWRTWSSKIIQLHEIGTWHVDVLGPDGKRLRALEFEIFSGEIPASQKVRQTRGTISVIDQAHETIVIEVPLKGGRTLTVAGPIAPGARLRKKGCAGSLQDLEVGDHVCVKWRVTNTGHLIEELDASQLLPFM